MDFRVDTSKLADFAYRLRYLRDTVDPAKTYTETWVKAGADRVGIYVTFASTVDDVNSAILACLDRIFELLDTAQTELLALKGHYASFDLSVADQYNAVLAEDASHTASRDNDYHVPGGDQAAADPSTELVTPTNAEPVPDLAQVLIDSAWDLLSPSYWILQLLTWCNGGKNPLDDALKYVSGDWNKACLGSEALDYLAAYHVSMAQGIDSRTDTVMETWEGNAANAAANYFNNLADSIDDIKPKLSSLADQFHTVAYGMWSSGVALADGLAWVCDLLIAAAVTAALTAATSWTGIGAAIGGLGLSAELVAIGTGLYMAYDIMGDIFNCVNAFVGVVAGFLGDYNSVDKLPLVGSLGDAYDSPLV
jgi:hypothetical protein